MSAVSAQPNTSPNATLQISGPGGTLVIPADDEIGRKLCMLIEGACGADGPGATARRYGYSTPRYFQLRVLFRRAGTAALLSAKRGPRRNYRRGGEVARQIIRYRFLDCAASTSVIGQKLRQDDWPISDRSVTRVITECGLQKRAAYMSAGQHAGRDGRDPSHQGTVPPRRRRRRRTATRRAAIAGG